MPSIAEATPSDRPRERRRLVAGVGLVLAGVVFIGLGAAGAVSGTAPKTGVVVGGVAVVASLCTMASRARLQSPERVGVAVGAAIATASGLFVWAVTPAGALPRPALAAVGGFGYLAGLAVMLAALLAGLTMHRPDTARRTGERDIAWTRPASDGSARRQAADGGTADDDLSFPLEDE